MKKLGKEETRNLLRAVEDSFPLDQCPSCECFLAYLAQLRIDSNPRDRDLFLPFKVNRKDMHGCLGCDPCPPGDQYADYLKKKKEPLPPWWIELYRKKDGNMLPRRNMFDHRKEARKKPVAFVPVYNQELNVLLGYLVDLTSRGAKVEGEHPVRVNQHITLSIEFPENMRDALPSPFKISARVVRCKQDDVSQYYNIGVEFTGITSKETKAIEAIIQRYAFRPATED